MAEVAEALSKGGRRMYRFERQVAVCAWDAGERGLGVTIGQGEGDHSPAAQEDTEWVGILPRSTASSSSG